MIGISNESTNAWAGRSIPWHIGWSMVWGFLLLSKNCISHLCKQFADWSLSFLDRWRPRLYQNWAYYANGK